MIEDIKVLFLDEDKEKVWETDYIIDTLLPKNINRIYAFITASKIEEKEPWDILVFNCRKNPYNFVLDVVNKTNPKIIIQLSDEYKDENLNHFNNLAKYCNLYLRQYNHEDYEYLKNTIHIPLGYCNDAGLDFLNYLPDEMNHVPKMKDRIYNWAWVGDMKNDRLEMLNKFSNIHSHTYATDILKDEMIEKYLQARFVPCGRGNSTLDCYRLYEASMCGAIPCVVGSIEEIENTFKYEESPPWIFARNWDDALNKCKELLQNEEDLQAMQDQVLEWWDNRTSKIKTSIIKALEMDRIQIGPIVENEKILTHYWDNDEIFGENWFSYPNLYKNIVKLANDGDIFVEVGAWKGRSTSCLAVEIANSKKDITLYVVDTWEGSIEHSEGTEQKSLPTLYETFIDNMKPVEEYYMPLKLTSEEASKKFKDKSLKFVFLDASHEYEDVKKDILNWMPKVKNGGILAGHDYYPDGAYDWFPGVKNAVNELIPNFDTQELCFIHHVLGAEKYKLEGFPSVNYISIKETEDRRVLLHKKFEEYGIKNFTPRIYDRYNDEDHQIESELLHRLSIGSRGPVTSHLKAIKEWYNETDEPYTIICEDDLGFQTVKYWNFTWKEFFKSLPEDWECVQLCLLREHFHTFNIGFRNRCWCDWSGCIYLISREHAKKLIENYYPDDVFLLNYVGNDQFVREEWARVPVIETIIYSSFGRVYSVPLFVEDVESCPSSYFNAIGIRSGETDMHHHNSFAESIKWWETKGQFKTLNELKVN
jgi:hypothetical protein